MPAKLTNHAPKVRNAHIEDSTVLYQAHAPCQAQYHVLYLHELI